MAKQTREIVAELDAFQPDDFEDDWLGEGYHRLRAACAELLETPSPEQGADALFALFERLEGKDLGPPGPVVHTLEKLTDYQTKLVPVVQRKPTTYTVWMVNRVLNMSPSPEHRQFLLGLLQVVLSHPLASETTKADAQRFLEYQQFN